MTPLLCYGHTVHTEDHGSNNIVIFAHALGVTYKNTHFHRSIKEGFMDGDILIHRRKCKTLFGDERFHIMEQMIFFLALVQVGPMGALQNGRG